MNTDDPFYQLDRRFTLLDGVSSGAGSEVADGFQASEDGGGGGGTPAPTHPFQLSDATEAGTAKVNIRFGMVAGITPTGMDPVDGKELSVGSSGYVVLAVTTDPLGYATSAAISIAASVPSNTATLGHIALGYVTKNTGPTSVTCSQSVGGSLWHQKCGETQHLFGGV